MSAKEAKIKKFVDESLKGLTGDSLDEVREGMIEDIKDHWREKFRRQAKARKEGRRCWT